MRRTLVGIFVKQRKILNRSLESVLLFDLELFSLMHGGTKFKLATP